MKNQKSFTKKDEFGIFGLIIVIGLSVVELALIQPKTISLLVYFSSFSFFIPSLSSFLSYTCCGRNLIND